MPVPHCTTTGRAEADARHFARSAGRERRTRARLAATLLAVVLASLLLPGDASASTVTTEETVTTTEPGTTVTTTRTTTSSPTPTPSTTAVTAPADAVCAAAASLTRQGRPGAALTLIDDARDAVGDDTAQRCAAEREAALLEQATGPAGPVGDVDRAWTAFAATWVAPFLGGLLIALAWVALWFVLAVRLLTALPWPHARLRSAGAQAALAVGAIVAALIAVVLLLGLLRERGRGTRFTADGSVDGGPAQAPLPFWILPAVLLAVAAALAAAHLLGRLRITLLARDKQGQTDFSEERTTQLIALLGRVGGSPPAGVEIPRGSDVTSLSESTLLPAPANAVAKAALAILGAVIGTTPWKVALDYLDEDTASVVVTRNGRNVQSAVLTTNEGLSAGELFGVTDTAGKRTMLCAQAAGVVIVALSRAHPGFEGLGGATDGRSVGLQFVATTTFADDPERAAQLLGRALRIDPGNWAADIALQNILHRRATDPAALRAYRDSLAARADVLAAGQRLLAQRVLITYFSVLVNLHAAATSELPPELHSARYALMEKLIEETRKADRRQEQDPLLLATERRFRTLRRAVDVEYSLVPAAPVGAAAAPPAAEDAEPLDPYDSYNSALHARQSGESATAAFRFRAAMTSLELRRWIRRDPDAVRYRNDPVIAEVVGGGSRERLWDLPLFCAHRHAFVGKGFATPLGLAAITNGEPAAADLGVTRTELARLVAAASLITTIWTVDPEAVEGLPDLREWRVDLAEILLEANATVIDPLRAPEYLSELRRRMPPTPTTAPPDALEVIFTAWITLLAATQ
ncbi:hypothetical protein [Rathayibacter sp. VKM Ac-2760]|uniref:hypothetical protein n=1 Tax=Rathayibacter sp. VKM Ac-2760 TaxID=2609253 RepID=UPI00131773FD|nr:hypothetical protein [Rathayibacter sp. VKM Ac-2760]QHC57298.1 hypothetical protein GSU72_00880 [Rathayibacter sp. VKM Ac-2760]